jgi:hypothetical protein
LEAAEEGTMAGLEGDIEVFAHMEQASLAGVMEVCLDYQFDVPSDVDLDGSDSEEDGSDGED